MLRQLALVALIVTASATALPLAAEVVEANVEIPVEVTDARGQAVRQQIQVIIVRDDARSRAPFMILNHGRSGDAALRQALTSAQYAANARYFVARGYAVFMPLRIGYGATGGPDVENSGRCAAKDYHRAYEAGARQSIAVIEYAKAQPYVDPARGVVAGQSFGGTIAMALAARNLPGILGAVNFAGGGGGRPTTHPEQPCGVERLTELFGSYGATARIPTLWLYSVNDKFWGPAIPRSWHKAFIDRGGMAEFVELPPYKSDGHPSFTRARDAWRPAVEAFLATCCESGIRTANTGPVDPPGRPATDTPEVFTRTLAAWAGKHKVERATIVVRRGGRVVHQAGIGGADPSSAVLLASLSKAITGACIATLVQDGKLGLQWSLSKALAKFFVAHGKPSDPRIEHVTIGQMLTHRAGFSSAPDGEDPATRSLLNAYLEKHSTREAPNAAYIKLLLGTKLLREPGEAFAYSNAGYMLLGAVIEEATGRSYERYCRDAVLQPAGASGALDPVWGVLWSTGGWRMTGADYLAFLDQHDPERATWGREVRDWTLDRRGKVIGTAKSQSWYGLGLRFGDAARSPEFWHTGTWRRRLAPDAQGPRSVETSLLAMRIEDGTSLFIHATPIVLDGARNELRRDLLRAHKAVREWETGKPR